MAFLQTVVSPMKGAERISRNLGIYAGKITVSSYATTLVECTAITKYFVDIDSTETSAAQFPHGIVSCVADGISESGFAFKWDATTGAFRCYYPTSIAATGLTIAVNSNVAGGSALLFASGGGAGALHATSAVGNIVVPATLSEQVGSEANANDAVGSVNFIAIGFVR